MGLIWRARRRLERPGHLWVDSIANPDRPPWWRRSRAQNLWRRFRQAQTAVTGKR